MGSALPDVDDRKERRITIAFAPRRAPAAGNGAAAMMNAVHRLPLWVAGSAPTRTSGEVICTVLIWDEAAAESPLIASYWLVV